MKKIYLLSLLITTTIATAQQLYLEAGKTSSRFSYKDSEGVKLNNLQPSNHTFMAIGYRDWLIEDSGLMGLIGVRYAGYGAIGSDQILGDFWEWDINCLELDAGLDYQLFSIRDSSIYLKGGTSIGFLLQGTQTINNEVFNLKNVKDFDKPMIQVKLGAGFSHPISDNLSFYIEYAYAKSLIWVSKPQKFSIGSNNIAFGLLIDIER